MTVTPSIAFSFTIGKHILLLYARALQAVKIQANMFSYGGTGGI